MLGCTRKILANGHVEYHHWRRNMSAAEWRLTLESLHHFPIHIPLGVTYGALIAGFSALLRAFARKLISLSFRGDIAIISRVELPLYADSIFHTAPSACRRDASRHAEFQIMYRVSCRQIRSLKCSFSFLFPSLIVATMLPYCALPLAQFH